MVVMAQMDLLVPMVPQVQLVRRVHLVVQLILAHKEFKEQPVPLVRLAQQACRVLKE
jgi:hypothetical protein